MSAMDETIIDLLEEHLGLANSAEKGLEKLRKMSNEQFIAFILNHSDRKELNSVISGGKFPAYDIAQRAQAGNWQLTAKQRHAITNVYLFNFYGWKQEELEADQ